MPTSLLEIIDLGNGEVVLQRAEDQDEASLGSGDPAHQQAAMADAEGADAANRLAPEDQTPDEQAIDEQTIDRQTIDRQTRDEQTPLVTIRFSDEARVYIMDQSLEVAKAMIQAGIQAVSQLAEQAEVEIEAEAQSKRSRTLH